MVVIKVPIIVIIFKIITTTSMIIIIKIITDSKLTTSSYRHYFPHCSFFEKNVFQLCLCTYWLTLSLVFKKSGNLFQILGTTYERIFYPWLVFLNGWLNLNKEVIHIQRTQVIKVFKDHWANTLFDIGYLYFSREKKRFWTDFHVFPSEPISAQRFQSKDWP